MKAVLAAAITLTAAALAVAWLPAWSATKAVPLLYIWAYSLIPSIAWLPVIIARRMFHRLHDPRPLAAQSVVLGSAADIDARVLQNTLEQLVFAVLATGLLTVAQAHGAAMLLLAHALFFTVGRACFWWGYRQRSLLRVYGFALTFFSSLGIFLYAASFLLRALILN